MTSVICDLYESSLRRDATIHLFDTAKATPNERSLWHAVTARFSLWRRWWSQLRSSGATIAHIHTCSGLSYFLDGALVLAARARGVSVVLHIHGGRFDAFLSELGPLSRGFARLIARSASRVVVLSDTWRARLAPLLPRVHWAVVENGVPVREGDRSRAESGEPLVVFLGAVCRAKGVEDLVRAAARLRNRARIVLVGPESESGMTEALQRLAGELGVAAQVELVGPAHGAEKTAWLTRATVFVLPSYVEALPISILEAMAAGVPVIATSVGAVPNVIRDGQTGLLIQPGDSAALAQSMDRLLADPDLRKQLAQQARKECAERYSIDRAARQLSGIYAEIA